MEAVPQDLIEGILLRLPVKSLLRFKCVCRPWHDLISDPKFVRKQISHARTTIYHKKDQPSIIICKDCAREFEVMVYCNRIELRFHPDDVPPELVDPEVAFSITGYCDGMFCVRALSCDMSMNGVHQLRHLFLWNPSIRDIKMLPSLAKYEHSRNLRCALFGLGYSPFIDDYYICKIPIKFSHSTSQVELLYLKSSSWRTIGHLPGYQVDHFQCPVSLNGNLYFLARRADADRQTNAILYFNAAKEKFEELALPENCGQARKLEIFQGHQLCLTTLSMANGKQTWLHTNSSWTYSHRIPAAHCSPWEVGAERPSLHRPLCNSSSCMNHINDEPSYEMVETLISPSRIMSDVQNTSL